MVVMIASARIAWWGFQNDTQVMYPVSPALGSSPIEWTVWRECFTEEETASEDIMSCL